MCGWWVGLGIPSQHDSLRHACPLRICRGLQARETDASQLQDPALYPSWQPDPLLVAASPQRFAKLDMSATLLTNCQVGKSNAIFMSPVVGRIGLSTGQW